MKFAVSNFLKKYSSDIRLVNRLLVTSFVSLNKIIVERNKEIINLLIQKTDNDFLASEQFSLILQTYNGGFTFEDLINCFECVLSPKSKIVNGAVYTPLHIRKHIVRTVLEDVQDDKLPHLLYADLACGCGSFFLSLLDYVCSKINVTCSNLFPRLYGVDIEEFSIERTKILLSLYALLKNEDKETFDFNLHVGNSLSQFWISDEVYVRNGGFDIVVGNPPYVSSSKIDAASKEYLCKWSVAKSGKADLYIPFFQIALESLRPNGVMGYITVNNFYRSVNGRELRKYLSRHEFQMKIFDFGSEQVFKGRSTYTCVCIIRNSEGTIAYIKSNSFELEKEEKSNFLDIAYNGLDDIKGWLLSDKANVIDNIKKIESTGTSLGDFVSIKNGFATLKNDIYVFTPYSEDEGYYYLEKNSKDYLIEKTICRNAVKPNTLDERLTLDSQMEKLIFPYIQDEGQVVLMSEDYLQTNYPRAYAYLTDYKKDLAQRDKGNRQYQGWYAYGRTQALNIKGYRLFFPYLASKPIFILSDDQELMFYNGYALVSDDLEQLRFLQKILCSKVFWYYIKNSSKPYGGEYMSLAKNYVKNFGIINMSPRQRRIFMELTEQKEIDEYLSNLYKLKAAISLYT